MISFATGQRVIVLRDHDGIALNATGTVRRVCSHGGAWIALDERSKVTKVHPFPADDDRGAWVLAYPDDCKMATKNHRERRAAKKDAERTAAIWAVDMTTFGKDHWSTFAYIETLCVDGNGRGAPDIQRMRCIDARHPFYGHGHDASAHPTRLKDGKTIEQHDDWDCIADLIAVGLLEDVGSAVNPRFKMTPRGFVVAAMLRRWKAGGGSFDAFAPTEDDVVRALVANASVSHSA